jgi:(1->4)-alpha-D-glucan 1-alpha-D-glucosylmutase
MVDDLCTDAGGADVLEAAYRRFIDEATSYEELVAAAKFEILDGSMAADRNRLVERLAGLCRSHRRYRDFSRRDLHDVLSEVVAAFPVYRTYVCGGRGG